MFSKNNNRKRIVAISEGKVQSVGYRAFCADHALRLGISGYVKNLPDGRVQLVGIADEATLRQMVEYMRQGPTFAHVKDVVFRWEDVETEIEGFEIKF
ncbi:MAG: acylphosphatase [Chloroflexi bacterium]|nr:acylphosphatase [Chloroflexota bacterium]|tara:strand:- start:74 stop:367 length:294 start_codon:yes stop_codon:yes gene_type:complete